MSRRSLLKEETRRVKTEEGRRTEKQTGRDDRKSELGGNVRGEMTELSLWDHQQMCNSGGGGG